MQWPKNKNQHKYMKLRKDQNKRSSKNNSNELWMYEKLKKTDYRWTRQAQWGYRLFDFWCAEIGVAVEVDGKEHNKVYDGIRDQYNYHTSGIIVLRVKNKNEKDADNVINFILTNKENWNDRRKSLGLKEISTLKIQKH